MKLNNITKLMTVALSAAVVTACSSDDETTSAGPVTLSFGMKNTKEISNDNNIPMPNDLYFVDAEGNKQANLVVMGCGETDIGVETAVENATKCSIEDLDGWSTTAPFSIPMTGDVNNLDEATFGAGVKLFNGTSALVFGTDYTVQVSSFGHLQILPLKVLVAETTYTLVITTALKDNAGTSVLGSTDYYNAKQSGVYADGINNAEANAIVAGVTASSILYAADFTTQTIGEELETLASGLTSAEVSFNSAEAQTYLNSGSAKPLSGAIKVGACALLNCVDKLQAEVVIPSYSVSSSMFTTTNCTTDYTNQKNAEFWFNLNGAEAHSESYIYSKSSCPGMYSAWDGIAKRVDETVKVLITYPYSAQSSNKENLDPIISAHGITAAKELGNGGMLVLDNYVQSNMALAVNPNSGTGHMVIAMDHILHGSRAVSLDNSVGYDCSYPSDGVADTGCEKGDVVDGNPVDGDGNLITAIQIGEYDISASSSVRGLFAGQDNADAKSFLKANALLTSRDNFRQVVMDMLYLKAAIDNGKVVDSKIAGKVTITSNTSVYGHSMGAIAAMTASGIEQRSGRSFTGTMLANPGGAIGGIIMNSNWLGKDEVPPAVKFLPEYRVRMAKELGLLVEGDDADFTQTLAAVRDYAESNAQAYLSKSDEIAPQFLAEFQYLIQSVVDTADPLNYASDLANENVLSISAVGNVHKNPELLDSEDAGLTAADQTVPIKVELGSSTNFERCLDAGAGSEAFTSSSNCFAGSEKTPYYSLNVTEFPLAGALPLEQELGLLDVNDASVTTRTAVRLGEGNHNMGVGALTDDVSQGTRDIGKVQAAADEVANIAVSFLTGSGTVTVTDTSLIAPSAE